MRIAAAYDNGDIAKKFGHANAFKVYQIDDAGKIQWGREIRVANMDEQHEEKANFLRGAGVSKLICGGICKASQKAVANAGIELFGGVAGDADKALDALLAGTLVYETDPDKLKCEDENKDSGEN